MFGNQQQQNAGNQPADIELEQHRAADLAKKDVLQYPMAADNDDGQMWDNDLQQKADDQVNFARKVLGIVASQMAVTFAVTLLASVVGPFGKFCSSPGVLAMSSITVIGSFLLLICDK